MQHIKTQNILTRTSKRVVGNHGANSHFRKPNGFSCHAITRFEVTTSTSLKNRLSTSLTPQFPRRTTTSNNLAFLKNPVRLRTPRQRAMQTSPQVRSYSCLSNIHPSRQARIQSKTITVTQKKHQSELLFKHTKSTPFQHTIQTIRGLSLRAPLYQRHKTRIFAGNSEVFSHMTISNSMQRGPSLPKVLNFSTDSAQQTSEPPISFSSQSYLIKSPQEQEKLEEKWKRTDAIDQKEFDEVMDYFSLEMPQNKFAVAVSGGPDSMALTFMARNWAQKHNLELVALTVDHKSSPEATKIADDVVKWTQDLGLKCEKLTVSENVQQQINSKLTREEFPEKVARRERYEILTKKCKELGIDHLLVAHQAEDQIETFFLRVSRLSGVDGLRAMERKLIGPNGIFLMRPCLDFQKVRLEKTCQENSIPYVTDATNEQEITYRNRIRKVFKDYKVFDSLGKEDALRLVNDLSDFHYSLQAKVEKWVDEHAEVDEKYGFLLLRSLQDFRDLDTTTALRVLARIVQFFNNEVYPIHVKKLMHLHHFVCDRSQQQVDKLTLANIMFLKRSFRFSPGPSGVIERLFLIKSSHVPAFIPIELEKPLRWGSFDITIFPTLQDPVIYKEEKFYVRHFRPADESHIPKKFKERAPKLLKEIRYGQPVICFRRTHEELKNGITDIVCVPHLGYNVRSSVAAVAQTKKGWDKFPPSDTDEK